MNLPEGLKHCQVKKRKKSRRKKGKNRREEKVKGLNAERGSVKLYSFDSVGHSKARLLSF